MSFAAKILLSVSIFFHLLTFPLMSMDNEDHKHLFVRSSTRPLASYHEDGGVMSVSVFGVGLRGGGSQSTAAAAAAAAAVVSSSVHDAGASVTAGDPLHRLRSIRLKPMPREIAPYLTGDRQFLDLDDSGLDPRQATPEDVRNIFHYLRTGRLNAESRLRDIFPDYNRGWGIGGIRYSSVRVNEFFDSLIGIIPYIQEEHFLEFLCLNNVQLNNSHFNDLLEKIGRLIMVVSLPNNCITRWPSSFYGHLRYCNLSHNPLSDELLSSLGAYFRGSELSELYLHGSEVTYTNRGLLGLFDNLHTTTLKALSVEGSRLTSKTVCCRIPKSSYNLKEFEFEFPGYDELPESLEIVVLNNASRRVVNKFLDIFTEKPRRAWPLVLGRFPEDQDRLSLPSLLPAEQFREAAVTSRYESCNRTIRTFATSLWRSGRSKIYAVVKDVMSVLCVWP